MRITKPATLIAAAAAAVAIAGSTFAETASARFTPDTTRIYRITTWANLAVDVQGGSTAENAPVIQWPINSGRNQQWTFVPVTGTSYHTIRNVNSRKCLSIMNDSVAPGARLVQYTCNPYRWSQMWRVLADPIGAPQVRFWSRSSGMVIDVPGGTMGWGTQLIQWPAKLNDDFSNGNQWFWLTMLA